MLRRVVSTSWPMASAGSGKPCASRMSSARPEPEERRVASGGLFLVSAAPGPRRWGGDQESHAPCDESGDAPKAAAAAARISLSISASSTSIEEGNCCGSLAGGSSVLQEGLNGVGGLGTLAAGAAPRERAEEDAADDGVALATRFEARRSIPGAPLARAAASPFATTTAGMARPGSAMAVAGIVSSATPRERLPPR
eukprot:scaffold284938_cov27-Tisochrysis_lutea.AAC.3